MSKKSAGLVQCNLKSGNSRMVALLEADRFKVGDSVTLIDSDNPEELWEVVTMSLPVNTQFTHREWHNNI